MQDVLNSLNQIESATYYATKESWAPGDTVPLFTFLSYYKEYCNPHDSTIGSSFVELLPEDTTQMTFCYDGYMRASVYEEEKNIVIDSFKVRPLPFRPLTPPFFNYAKNIMKYALETNDSIATEFEDFGDSEFFRLTILEDSQVEFFGKAFYIENSPYNLGETTSKYELWINKSDNLPYRIRREMSHDISVITCWDVELNKIKLDDFKTSDYFNPEYSIRAYGQAYKRPFENALLGKPAPDWILNDDKDNPIALKDLKSKVLMIQFTSVTCGPCRASIQFLKQLASEYNQNDFDFVSIESWTRNSNVLELYKSRNNFTYRFLMSTPDVTRSYQIQSVPVFYILDENRVIRNVIRGYASGSTDNEIKDAINELI